MRGDMVPHFRKPRMPVVGEFDIAAKTESRRLLAERKDAGLRVLVSGFGFS